MYSKTLGSNMGVNVCNYSSPMDALGEVPHRRALDSKDELAARSKR